MGRNTKYKSDNLCIAMPHVISPKGADKLQIVRIMDVQQTLL